MLDMFLHKRGFTFCGFTDILIYIIITLKIFW